MPRRKNETDDPLVRSPSCPRCGYDLTGVVESWSEQCPVEGVCSECGLGFDWADILDPKRQSLYWLYEHRRGIALVAFLKTTLIVFIPWVFWRRVRLHHWISPRRLCLYPAVYTFALVVVPIVLAMIVLGIRALSFGNNAIVPAHSFLSWSDSLLFVLFSPFGWVPTFVTGWYRTSYQSDVLLLGVMIWSVSLGMWIASVIAQSSRAFAKVRGLQLFRGVMYSIVPASIGSALYLGLWLCDRVVRIDYGKPDLWIFSNGGIVRLGRWGAYRYEAWQWVEHPAVFLLMPFSFVIFWWLFALRNGYQLRGWWQVWIAGAVIGPLVTLVMVWGLPHLIGLAF